MVILFWVGFLRKTDSLWNYCFARANLDQIKEVLWKAFIGNKGAQILVEAGIVPGIKTLTLLSPN